MQKKLDDIAKLGGCDVIRPKKYTFQLTCPIDICAATSEGYNITWEFNWQQMREIAYVKHCFTWMVIAIYYLLFHVVFNFKYLWGRTPNLCKYIHLSSYTGQRSMLVLLLFINNYTVFNPYSQQTVTSAWHTVFR